MQKTSKLKAFHRRVRGLLKVGRRRLMGKPERAEPARPERRVTDRLPLRIAVQACVAAGKFRNCRMLDINLRGFALEAVGEKGQLVAVTFAGLPDVAPKFTLIGEIVRRLQGDAVGARVDRRHTSPESLEHYRKLVLYYIRHRPLLEDVRSGYFEGCCQSCGWIGRVGARSPECSRCGGLVKPLTGQP